MSRSTPNGRRLLNVSSIKWNPSLRSYATTRAKRGLPSPSRRSAGRVRKLATDNATSLLSSQRLMATRTRVRDARVNTTYFFYDALDRQRAMRDALANISYFAYDSVGNRTKAVSPRVYPTYFAYDGLNRLSRVLDATGGSAYFGYDSVSNVTKTQDA